MEISQVIESCLDSHDSISNPELEDIYTTMEWTKNKILKEN